MPPGGVEPEEGETLEYISGHYRIFQYERGHRFSTDDVLTAWYGTQTVPRAERIADLGSGIGSVALVVAWRLPGARVWTIEAQEISARLARRSVAYNGLSERFTIATGDLRQFDPGVDFDLVLGSPPYFPPGTATASQREQAVPARIEMRGDVEAYAATAARIVAPGGVFAFVFPFARRDDAGAALEKNRFVLIRRRDVVFREGDPPLISLFAAIRREDLPPSFARRDPLVEPSLVIRRTDGRWSHEYEIVRMSFGFPPEVGPG
jgi:tRNA1Val (adenine37-N6)-methyltransferase